MDDYFEELKKDASENETGLTNGVFFTQKGTVVKTYSRYPITSFIESLTGLLQGEINYLSRDERMKNEIEVKKIIRELGFNAPEALEVGENSIEFEKVPGVEGFSFLKKSSKTDSERFGRNIGVFLQEVHSRGVAINDFRLSNIHVNSSFELYYIDHEYSKLNANFLMKKVDQLTLFSSARQTGNFKSFVKGFKQSNVSISHLSLLLSIFVFGYHAALFERDSEKFIEGMKSLFVL